MDAGTASGELHEGRPGDGLSHLAGVHQQGGLWPAHPRPTNDQRPSPGLGRQAWSDPRGPRGLSSLRRAPVLQSRPHVPRHARREHGGHQGEESATLADSDGATADRPLSPGRGADRDLHRRAAVCRPCSGPAVPAASNRSATVARCAPSMTLLDSRPTSPSPRRPVSRSGRRIRRRCRRAATPPGSSVRRRSGSSSAAARPPVSRSRTTGRPNRRRWPRPC
jgi:hypothetical protein